MILSLNPILFCVDTYGNLNYSIFIDANENCGIKPLPLRLGE